MIKHNIKPIYDKNSQVLILGSFPSPKSRENGIFYGNPQNRFWKVLSKVFNEKIGVSAEEKREFCLKKHIALWDVVGECEIEGANDATIKNVKPNDIKIITNFAPIKAIFTTGTMATKLYRQYFDDKNIYLPSTSPTNFHYKIEDLIKKYAIVLNVMGKEVRFVN